MTEHQDRISKAMKAHWKKRKARFARAHTGLLRYVPWQSLDAFHKRGWMVVADLGPTHGIWSVLMWHCECGEAQG